jgi:histidine triad (HIT) family protein
MSENNVQENKEVEESEKTIFEKIIAGELPCHKIYEDDLTFAFLDIQPHNPGHTLVISKEPYKNIYETPDEVAAALLISAKKVAIAVKEAVDADGIKIIMNNEPAAGQIVFHDHIHVIPRFENDDWPKFYEYKEGEAEEIAKNIYDKITTTN